MKHMKGEWEEDQDTIRALRLQVKDLEKQLKVAKLQMIAMQGGDSAVSSANSLMQELDDIEQEMDREIAQEKITNFRRKWDRRKRERAEQAAGTIFCHWRDWALYVFPSPPAQNNSFTLWPIRKKKRLREEEELTLKFLLEEQKQRQIEAERKEYNCVSPYPPPFPLNQTILIT